MAERLTGCAGSHPNRGSYPVLTGVTIERGAMVALTSAGYAQEAALASGGSLKCVGVASHTIANPGASGAEVVECEFGVFGQDLNGSDTPTFADVGEAVYVVNDHTVANADGGGGARIKAGVLTEVRDGLAWVYIGPHVFAAI